MVGHGNRILRRLQDDAVDPGLEGKDVDKDKEAKLKEKAKAKQKTWMAITPDSPAPHLGSSLLPCRPWE